MDCPLQLDLGLLVKFLYLDGVVQLVPPHGEVDGLRPDERHVGVLGQLVHHVVQDGLGLVGVVLVHCLQPAGVVVGVRHQNHSQFLTLASSDCRGNRSTLHIYHFYIWELNQGYYIPTQPCYQLSYTALSTVWLS